MHSYRLVARRPRRSPLQALSKWLALALRQRAWLGSAAHLDLARPDRSARKAWESPFDEVELLRVRPLDDRLSPVEALLRLFRFCPGDPRQLLGQPDRLKRMIGWRAEDGDVDELIKDVLFSLEKEKKIAAAEQRKGLRNHRHPRAVLHTRL